MCRDTTNVEHEMYERAGNNWKHRNSNMRFEEKFGGHSGKTLDMINSKISCTGNVTQNT
jgi:hypothetical protein